MDVLEFAEMINFCYQQLKTHEVNTLFKHFDTKGLGYITKSDFQKGLTEKMALENKLHFFLHDFMTPLQTLARE